MVSIRVPVSGFVAARCSIRPLPQPARCETFTPLTYSTHIDIHTPTTQHIYTSSVQHVHLVSWPFARLCRIMFTDQMLDWVHWTPHRLLPHLCSSTDVNPPTRLLLRPLRGSQSTVTSEILRRGRNPLSVAPVRYATKAIPGARCAVARSIALPAFGEQNNRTQQEVRDSDRQLGGFCTPPLLPPPHRPPSWVSETKRFQQLRVVS